MPPSKFGIGQAVTRKEDDALLRGEGRYVADHAPAGAFQAVVLRSPHAHARFRIEDVADVRAMPGVALVLTGADTADLGHLPCQGEVPDTRIDVPPYPILARDQVRHVGGYRDDVARLRLRRGAGGVRARRSARGALQHDRRHGAPLHAEILFHLGLRWAVLVFTRYGC
ncbi:MAG: aerobic carbon-monoxide dehydrogenase large subunit [Alphaproteobacteria bacterium]|jgi:xanthine dehydrogenase molybdopterin-binding subunit B|nr:aerobic carbon-monoxide dehydrogenase large subunit [Alphaproteobacteria bacterium]